MMLMMVEEGGKGSAHEAVTFLKPQAGKLSAAAFLLQAHPLTWQYLTGRQQEISRQSGVQNELVSQTPLARSSRFGGQGFAPSTSQNHHSFSFLGLGHEPSGSGEL